MKSLKTIPIFLALFVAFIASESFADKPYTEIEIMHWPGANFYNPCAEEVIIGDMDFKIIRHYNKDGELKAEHWSIASGVLIGQVTGKVYQPTGANMWKFDVKSQGAHTYMEKMLIHAVAPGTQIKFFIEIHWTINANGETTVYMDSNTWGDCK